MNVSKARSSKIEKLDLYYLLRIQKFKAVGIITKDIIMEEKELEFFKGLLNDQMEELLNQAGCSVADMSEEIGSYGDPLDRASLEIDRSFTLRIRDRESRLIKKIKKALERIEDGTFWICERCGEEISIKRLKARPVATLCIECKTKEETIEKVIGI